MRGCFIVVVILLLAVALDICLNIQNMSMRDEMCMAQKITDAEQTAAIAALKKEVRLLKTDVHIIQYGFEDRDEKTDNTR